MTEPLYKSYSDLLEEELGPGYTSDWAVQNFLSSPLMKAVATMPGLSLNGQNMGDYAPLMLQNLDNVLTSVLFQKRHFKLFGMLPRKPSMNLIYQYDKQLSYGDGRASGGFIEGGVPTGGVSQFERDTATIRFFGVRRGITHPLMRVGELGGAQLDPVTKENHDGTMQLLERMERNILFGDSSILSEAGQEINYDGILKQVKGSPYASTNYLNFAGAPLGYETFDDLVQQLVETAFVTDFDNVRALASPQVLTDLSKLRYQADRHDIEEGRVGGKYSGLPFKGHSSVFGDVPLQSHLFFNRVLYDTPLQTIKGGAPGAPAAPATVVPTAGGTDAVNTLNFTGSTVYYSVSSFNDHGESLAAKAIASATPTTGQHVSLAITNPTGTPTGFRIYRGLKADGSDAKWIGDAPVTTTTTTFVDTNAKIPGTSMMMLWINDEETIVVPQFMPLMKWPLAVVQTAIEWLLILYHTVVLKAPQRFLIIDNIGKLS